MKALLLLLFVPALAVAQNTQNAIKQGEEVFNKTCANGYCHGPAGAGAGAPRLAARGFDQAYIMNTVTRGIPNTGMAAYESTMSRSELTAVVAYVAKLNGIASPASATTGGDAPAPALSPDARRGRDLFSDAVRSFGRCSTCHEVNGFGIPVAAPISNIPANAAALKTLPTPRVSSVSAAGETMPALVLAKKSGTVLFYDLTVVPPVLRTESPASVQIRDASNWRHASAISAYSDSELSLILTYLRAAMESR